MKISRLKRFLAGLLFAAMLGGLSVTSSLAATVPAFKPGCDGKASAGGATDGTQDYTGFFGLQEGHANAVRVRDRTYARQIQHQNDNSMGMTCFDHALALTGHLGQVFSDVHPVTVNSGPGIPGPQPANNTSSFGTSTFPNYGSDQYLSTDLNVLVAPTLKSHAAQFPASISSQLGATSLNFLSGFMGPINAAINQVLQYMNTLNSLVNNLQTLMNFFNQMLEVMNVEPPDFMVAFAAFVKGLYTALSTGVEIAIQTLLSTVNTLISGTISSLLTGAQSLLSSFGNANSATNDCARIQNLWGVPTAAGGGTVFNFPPTMLTGTDLRALTASGRQPGTAYTNFANLLLGTPGSTGALATASGGIAGPELMKEMTAGSNGKIITRASQDKSNNLMTPGTGILGTDGVWPTIPTSGTGSPFTIPVIACGSSGCNTGNAAALIAGMN